MLYVVITLICVVIDQLVKWGTVAHFPLGEGMELIPGVVRLLYIQNRGAAWGILQGQMVFFYLITVIAVFAIIYLMIREKQAPVFARIGYSLLLAGAIGNFIDRVWLGYVVDMFQLQFIQFPVFNVADMCLTIGVGMLFIYYMWLEGKGATNP